MSFLLQYFIDKRYRSAFTRGYLPKIEYICNVDSESSKMPRSMHEHEHLIEMLLVYHGAGIYMINGERYTAKEGDLILYNSHTVHDEFGGSGNDLSTYCIAVSGLKLEGLPTDTIVPSSCSPVLPTGKYFDVILQCYKTIEQECLCPDGAEIANHLTLALILKISHLLKEYGQPCRHPELTLATATRKFIDKHYRENIHLEDIAQATCANAYYLSHIFKAETGLSPMKYVTLRRIGEAQNLLINTPLTITQIASTVGYNNSNYFQNVFRAAVNMTPGDYRRKWTQ